MTGPFFKSWARGETWAKVFSGLSFFSLGLGWGLHFWDVHDAFGASSANVAYTLLLLVGFITSSSTTLIGDKTSFYIFVTTLTVSVIITYLSDHEMNYTYVVIFILIYLIFSLGNFKLGHEQLYSVLKAKAKSKAEEERLKNIINAVPGFVTLYDGKLRCFMANARTLNLFPDIIGQQIGNLTYKTKVEKMALEFYESDKISSTFEYQTEFQGREATFVTSIQKMRDEGIIIVSIETTELHDARKQLRDQEAKSYYTAKLASLGEMAAGIAHEINNPLTIIQGGAKIVKKLSETEPIDLESIRMLCGKMVDTSERISKTIKSLKALSRSGESDPMEAVRIQTFVDECLDLCGQRFKRHEIELRLPQFTEEHRVQGREVQLGQVLLNLLGNAIDAVKGSENPWVEIRIEKQEKFLDVLVSDSGPGIPENLRERIMEPFFTTKEVNQGTGLGLSISKRIMQDHQGELSLLTDKPHTTFRMRFPLT